MNIAKTSLRLLAELRVQFPLSHTQQLKFWNEVSVFDNYIYVFEILFSLKTTSATSFMNGIFKTNFSSPQVRFHTFYINSYMDLHTTSVKLYTGVRIRYVNPLSRYDRVAISKLFERPWFLETSRGMEGLFTMENNNVHPKINA